MWSDFFFFQFLIHNLSSYLHLILFYYLTQYTGRKSFNHGFILSYHIQFVLLLNVQYSGDEN